MDSKTRISKPVHADRAELIVQAQELERLGLNRRAREAFEKALRRARNEPADASVAAIMRWIGNTLRAEGDLDAASDCYEASLASATADLAQLDMAHALNWLAIVHQERGDVQSAQELYTEARALAHGAGDVRLAAMVGQNLGSIAAMRGQLARAVRYYSRSLVTYREAGDTRSTARLLNNLALVQLDLGEWLHAEQTLTEAAQLCADNDDLSTSAMVETNWVALEVRRGDLAAALLTCQRAHHLANRIDHKIALGEIYKWYGLIYRETGQFMLAESHLKAAAEVAARCENLLLEAEVQRELAILYLKQDRNPAALRALTSAHDIFNRMRARPMLQDVDRTIQELETTFLEVVRRWGDSIEEKDHYTRGHCQRVADYACLLARAAGLKEHMITWFRMGAFLHDVGKTAIPAELLNKPTRLTTVERSMMQQHTVIGEALLSAVEFPLDIRPMIRSHHERWDGSGYPDRLAGTGIPLAARILGIADYFDALSSERSYRSAHSTSEALAIMNSDAGAFDPELFELFTRVVSDLPAHSRVA